MAGPIVWGGTGQGGGWGAKTRPKAKRPGYSDRFEAGTGWNPGGQAFGPNTGWGGGDASAGIDWGGGQDWITDREGGSYGGISAPTGGEWDIPGRGGSIAINDRPDYRGILDRYTADWRARINQGLQSMHAQRLGNAKGLINRLGVRDPQAMLAKVGKFGLTLADLQLAADNPFSDIKGIDRQAEVGRGQGLAQMSGRGGLRSGGSTFITQETENARARNEALASEEALRGLAQGEEQVANWGLQQEDQLAQRAADLELDLSQRYQPQEATWDDASGGYRWGNKVYDQFGNLLRTL